MIKNIDIDKDYSIEEAIDKVINQISKNDSTRIQNCITLPLRDLLKPRNGNKTTPRQQNSFIIYRKDKFPRQPNYSQYSVPNFSKIAADMWNNETNDVKEVFKLVSLYSKKVHSIAFPHYKYCPKKKIQENINVQKNDLLDTLEITPNFMDSYDKNILNKFNTF